VVRKDRGPVWLFDLDNTLHNASHAAFGHINQLMTAYIVRELVKAAHFLHHTHLLPGLEARVHGHPHDFAALRRLKGRRYILTNAPADYTARVLGVLGIATWFDGILSIEDMHMFGDLRPKPDARMLRRTAVKLGVTPARCVLVEDTLEHQKAARRVGMKTVWMQRWSRAAQASGAPASVFRPGRPSYVDRRVSRLSDLLRGA
jgi:putative hydrolase of the HAD superfamily